MHGWYWWEWPGWGSWFGGYGWIGMIFSFVFFILIIAAVIFVLKKLLPNDRYSDSYVKHSSSRALEILKERYAKGEISEEEFLRMKKNLEN